MMNATIPEAIVAASSNPKVGTLVATGTTTLAAASKLDYLQAVQGYLSTATMAVGLATGIVVLICQLIKLRREWKDKRADGGV